MKNILFLVVLVSILSCNKEIETPSFEKIKLSEKETLREINDSTLHNAIGKDEIITDEKTAISIAEPLLFSVYGKENIVKQRPYKIGKVQNYWVVSGSLPKPQIGGVFEMIIDSKNGEIIRLTHGE
jgi:hypothetical protein